MVKLQELHLLALAASVQEAHTLRLSPLSALLATVAVGLPQTPLSVQIAQPVLTTAHQELRA